MEMFETVFDNQFSFRPDIMACITDRLSHALNQAPKVMVVRVDVRFPRGYPHGGRNDEISELMRRMKDYYGYHSINFFYTWVREQNASENPHYHTIIFLSGTGMGDGYSVWKRATHFFSLILGGNYGSCVHLCRTQEGLAQIRLDRDPTPSDIEAGTIPFGQFETTLQVVLRWASYLAKTRTKGNAPYRVREYQGSQI